VPQGRWAASLAYDAAHHSVVLFGGLAGQTVLGDTWSWDGSTWSAHQGLSVSPPARQGGAMAYDEARHQVLLFGGVGASGSLNDTWVWDGTAWQELRPSHSPSARDGATMVFDPALGSVILFGGMDDTTAMPSPMSDTWSWNGTDWAQLPAPSPGGGVRPRMAFLGGANLVERFGDCVQSHDATVYGFDGMTWVPKTSSGTPPPALCLPALAGDTNKRLIVMFGGNTGTGAAPPVSTWTYDGNVWTRLSPTASPSPRYDAAMVYDSDNQAVVLFGGQGLASGHTGALNDLWTWNGTTWTAH